MPARARRPEGVEGERLTVAALGAVHRHLLAGTALSSHVLRLSGDNLRLYFV